MATIHFTSSDTFCESEPRGAEHATIEIEGYIEATYDTLKSGPNGEAIAYFKDDAWELEDGQRFSDWAVAV